MPSGRRARPMLPKAAARAFRRSLRGALEERDLALRRLVDGVRGLPRRSLRWLEYAVSDETDLAVDVAVELAQRAIKLHARPIEALLAIARAIDGPDIVIPPGSSQALVHAIETRWAEEGARSRDDYSSTLLEFFKDQERRVERIDIGPFPGFFGSQVDVILKPKPRSASLILDAIGNDADALRDFIHAAKREAGDR